MSVGLALVLIGLIVAVTLHSTIGIILAVVGLVLLLTGRG